MTFGPPALNSRGRLGRDLDRRFRSATRPFWVSTSTAPAPPDTATPLVAVMEIFLPFSSRFDVAASTTMPFLPSMRTFPSLWTVILVPTESRKIFSFPSPVSAVMPSVLPFSSSRSIRCPFRETEGAPVDGAGSRVDEFGALATWRVGPVVETTEYVRPLRILLFEGHQHLVAYFGNHHGAAVFACSGLHGAGPVTDVVIGEPRKGEFHPALVGRVVGVADLCDNDSGAGGGPAPTRRQAIKAALLATRHRERRRIPAMCRVVAVSRGGDRVLSVERLAGILDLDTDIGPQFGVSSCDSVDFGERTSDLFRQGLCCGVCLRLRSVGHVGGDVLRIAERLGHIRGLHRRQVNAFGARGNGADDLALLGDVPAAHLDLGDLFGSGDNRPESQ